MSRMSCALRASANGFIATAMPRAALAALEQGELVGDVALALAGEARVLRVGRVAVEAMAGGAGAGLGRAGLGIAPGGLGSGSMSSGAVSTGALSGIGVTVVWA